MKPNIIKVLLIDDDRNVRETIADALMDEGFDVVVAKDGEAGLESLATMTPDIVITDLFMPNADGMEVILDIRKADIRMPIIAISGGPHSMSVNFLDQAAALGASAALAKPFRPSALVALIRECLEKAGDDSS